MDRAIPARVRESLREGLRRFARVGLPRRREVMPRRRILKLAGIALAVVIMCTPLFFWPGGESGTSAQGRSKVTITIPPVAVVSTDSTDAAGSGSGTTEIQSGTAVVERPIDITIAAVGSIVADEDVLLSALDSATGQYDFRPIFAAVGPYLWAADYTVCNLEMRPAGPITGSDTAPPPNWPTDLAEALVDSGVDLAATGNSYSLEQGRQGVVSTLDRLDEAGIAHVGTYRSMEEKKAPFIVDIEGVRVAFLDYTEGLSDLEASEEYADHADHADYADYAVNILDVDAIAKEAMTARIWGAEVVLAILHFGGEYDREPSEEQTEISEGSREVEGLLSRGVDVILGAHPHVVQPIVKVLHYPNWRAQDTYVAYSLGDFLAEQRWRYSDSGIVAYVHIQKDGLRTRVTGISYLPVYTQVTPDDEATVYRILPVFPGLVPDVEIKASDEERMDEVWEEMSALLYRPDEGIVPVNPFELATRQ